MKAPDTYINQVARSPRTAATVAPASIVASVLGPSPLAPKPERNHRLQLEKAP